MQGTRAAAELAVRNSHRGTLEISRLPVKLFHCSDARRRLSHVGLHSELQSNPCVMNRRSQDFISSTMLQSIIHLALHFSIQTPTFAATLMTSEPF